MGGGRAVDGGLDDGVLVAKGLDEGGVRGRFALDDAEARVREEGGGKERGVPEEGGDGVLFIKASCEGGGTDATWEVVR